jgi:hypothetical protein
LPNIGNSGLIWKSKKRQQKEKLAKFGSFAKLWLCVALFGFANVPNAGLGQGRTPKRKMVKRACLPLTIPWSDE